MIIQSVNRASNILSLFSLNKPSWGISEIAQALNLNKATVQGLVRTLVYIGFLQQNPETKKYQLGLKTYELGTIAAGSLEINQKASISAHKLAKRTRLLVRIAILEGSSAIVTLDAYPRSEPFIMRQFGPRVPLYCTAVGKALLAFFSERELLDYLGATELKAYTTTTLTKKRDLLNDLRETKERGYSINRAEHFLGRAAIGAPIFARQGKLVGAMCISGDPDRVLGNEIEDLVSETLQTSLEVSRQMGYFPEAHLTAVMNGT
jgi:DNA-binding IclR family transcriptional regulator